MEQILGAARRRRVGLDPGGPAPVCDRLGVLTGPEVCEAEVQEDPRVAGTLARQPLEARDGVSGPGREGRADLGCGRVVAGEDGFGLVPFVVRIEPLRPPPPPVLLY